MILASLLFAAATAVPPKPVPPADLANPPADAQREAGLIWRELKAPTGTDRPSEDDLVRVHYTIWSAPDAKLIDSIRPGLSVVVPIGRLMLGFRQALLGMRVGEERRIWITENMGAIGKVPPGGMMVIDAQLIEVIHPPVTPSDLTSPPADAITTKSGLIYKVLRRGTGTKHPGKMSTVRVHYSGWQVSGHMIDSSVLRGEPIEFSLQDVIAGWREGVQLMTEGELARFWIPANLAYAKDPAKPQGMLIFDIELLKIVK